LLALNGRLPGPGRGRRPAKEKIRRKRRRKEKQKNDSKFCFRNKKQLFFFIVSVLHLFLGTKKQKRTRMSFYSFFVPRKKKHKVFRNRKKK